jgi:hypothetical protein
MVTMLACDPDLDFNQVNPENIAGLDSFYVNGASRRIDMIPIQVGDQVILGLDLPFKAIMGFKGDNISLLDAGNRLIGRTERKENLIAGNSSHGFTSFL